MADHSAKAISASQSTEAREGRLRVKGGHEMDAVGQSLTRPLYPRELTDLMQRQSVSG